MPPACWPSRATTGASRIGCITFATSPAARTNAAPAPARRRRFWPRCATPCSPSSGAPAASPSKDSNTSPNTAKPHWTPLPAGEPNDPGRSFREIDGWEHSAEDVRWSKLPAGRASTAFGTLPPRGQVPHNRCKSHRAAVGPGNGRLPHVDEMTLLVNRPDGYVELRADCNHIEALSAYLALLGAES